MPRMFSLAALKRAAIACWRGHAAGGGRSGDVLDLVQSQAYVKMGLPIQADKSPGCKTRAEKA